MTNKSPRILEIWNELEQAQASDGLYKLLYDSNIPFNIFGIVNLPYKHYGIAFNISDDFKIDISGFANLKDLRVSLERDSSSRLLVIQILDPYCKDIFAVLCENLIREVINIEDEKRRIRSILNQLEKWKDMFDKINSDGLTSAQQQGLYGELHFLQKFLALPNTVPTHALKSWVGSDAALRDFQGSSWAVEVKTTATNNPQSLKINGERQLDESFFKAMFLYHCSVEVSNSNGETLPQKIKTIREILAQDTQSVNLFNSKLFAAGYDDRKQEHYSKCYQIRRESFYRINKDFPRIKENELRNGVGDVKYSISIGLCNEYLVPESQIFSTIAEYE